MKSKRMPFILTVAVLCAVPAIAQDMPADYEQVVDVLGKTADFKDGVLKVNIPRNDVSVTVAGVKTPTPFGFGGWIAMSKGTGGMEVMMGDLVLLQAEVNPVMSACSNNGLDVTALHNHFFLDEPRMFYMHVHGHGTAAELARKVKPALDLIGRASGAPRRRRGPPRRRRWTPRRWRKSSEPRASKRAPSTRSRSAGQTFKIAEMGAPINARMGLNTWAAFVGTNANAAIAGDVAMLAAEVTPVLKALRQNGLDVVAIHHHMTDTQPTIFFLHYWGTGPATKLATAFKAALDQLGPSRSAAARK